ncbi:MAG: thioredoxin family protein [Patescibacteria group bacterium]
MKVLKFGSATCPGCAVMKPRWAEIESENDWLATEFFDIDENPDAAEKWGIDEIPQFIFLDKNGAEIERYKGEVDKDLLVATIRELRNR